MSTISDFLPSIYNSSQSLTSTIISSHDRRERRLNYEKTQVNSVHHIECRCLYRVLMKIELPFRGPRMKNLRHRFIRLLYETACSHQMGYTSIIDFVKLHLGLYISLTDSRQLVLYSAIFGPTHAHDFFSPPSHEDIRRVINSCPLSVPPFVHFKKWSADVKELEQSACPKVVTV